MGARNRVRSGGRRKAADPAWPGEDRRRPHLSRVPCAASIAVARGEEAFAADLVDVSPAGCRVRARAAIGVGERVTFTFPSGLAIRGEVRWQNDGAFGALFDLEHGLREMGISAPGGAVAA